MKIYILFTIFIVTTYNLAGQSVGINTINPQTLFHVDGKGDTAGNTNISDDVIVNANGSIGISTLSPAAKLHIARSGSSNPILLNDGTQGNNKVLTSDSNGYASWVPRKGVMLKAIVDLPGNTHTIIGKGSNSLGNNQGTDLLTNVPLQASMTGNYLIILRWIGCRPQTTQNFTSLYIRVYKNGNINYNNLGLDNVEHYITAQSTSPNPTWFSFSTILYVQAVKGDIFNVTVLPTNDASWIVNGNLNSTSLKPSIIVVKI